MAAGAEKLHFYNAFPLRASAIETDVTVATLQRAREIWKFYVALIEMGPREARAKILRSTKKQSASPKFTWFKKVISTFR